jgi:hypothetical protein
MSGIIQMKQPVGDTVYMAVYKHTTSDRDSNMFCKFVIFGNLKS